MAEEGTPTMPDSAPISKEAMGIYLDYANDLELLGPHDPMPDINTYLDKCPEGERDRIRDLIKVWEKVSLEGRRIEEDHRKGRARSWRRGKYPAPVPRPEGAAR